MGIIMGIGLAGLVLIASQGTVGASDPTPSPTPLPPVNILVIGDAEYQRELSDVEREERLRNGLPVPTTVYLDPALIAEPDHSPIELPMVSTTPQDFVDNWEALYSQDFEGVFPDASGVCQLIDADALSEEYLWDDDNHRSHQGYRAAWPANGGNDGLDPASNPYPNGMKTQMVCGPFDLSQAYNAMTEFASWYNLPDTDDRMFFGVSGDGGTFHGFSWSDNHTYWTTFQVSYSGLLGDSSIWVMWQFESDASDNAEGPWLDDIVVWRYIKPSGGCDIPDPGGKGLNLPSYVGYFDQQIPILRDVNVVDLLEASDVGWVRLEFINEPNTTGSGVSRKDYDLLVDTLCAHDIPVLGLVDYQTLERMDWQTDEYRAEFTHVVTGLVEYFDDRIGAWEVWNEPDFSGTRLDPPVYANLLSATYDAIEATEPDDLVLFGGLGSADPNADDYLRDCYGEFGGSGPFDVFALHPYISTEYRYTDGRLMLDPQDYMHYEPPTIIQKFLDRLTSEGDGGKDLWATESGWNSAKGVPAGDNCPAIAEQLVSRVEQANYLTSGFDILFNEPEWNPGAPAITKIFWYQFSDTTGAVECNPTLAAGAGQGRQWSPSWNASSNALLSPQLDTVPWYFGLYDSDRKPKLAQCHYRCYPDPCYGIYLPTLLRSQ
jgi:hypothetical protein